MKRCGFTLLELLVVLGIIMLLAAILFPVMSPTHHHPSRRSHCQNNLKQIGLAFMQYTQDYDEQLPPIKLKAVSASIAPYRTPYGWADAIQPYLKSTQIYQCSTENNLGNRTADAVMPNFTEPITGTTRTCRH